MIAAQARPRELRLSPKDLLHALADLDAALVLIGTAAGARIGFTVTLARRELLDDVVPERWPEGEWFDFARAVDGILPPGLSVLGIEWGQVETLPVRKLLAPEDRV